MRISVLVATSNRCEKLRAFLDATKAGSPAWAIETEVLVVDNNSNDRTKQVVSEYTASEGPAFRYVFESRPGKSRALNSAISKARGEIIAFTDDDCIPSPDWVESILREFESDPQLSVLGGRVELYDEKDLQQATLISKRRAHVRLAAEVCSPPTIIGANMAFRKEALDSLRGFDPFLGPGTACRAGEDLDIIYRSLKRGMKIAYSPQVSVFHNHGRRTRSEEDRTSFGYALGRGAIYFKHGMRLDFHIAGIALKELYDLVKTLTKGVMVRTQFPYHRLTLPGLFLGALRYCQARCAREKLLIASMYERGHAGRCAN